MTKMTTFNNNRQSRTEARITEILVYLAEPKYKTQILDEFCPRWGVSDETVEQALQTAVRTKRVVYERGLYKTMKDKIEEVQSKADGLTQEYIDAAFDEARSRGHRVTLNGKQHKVTGILRVGSGKRGQSYINVFQVEEE